jgi:hypothetical protein
MIVVIDSDVVISAILKISAKRDEVLKCLLEYLSKKFAFLWLAN